MEKDGGEARRIKAKSMAAPPTTKDLDDCEIGQVAQSRHTVQSKVRAGQCGSLPAARGLEIQHNW